MTATRAYYAMAKDGLFFKLRKSEIGGENIYRLPFYPFLPCLYLTGILALLFFRAVFEWEKSLVDIAFIATGLPFSFIWCRRAGKLSH